MVRRPAVAGRFYPDQPAQLTADIRGFLADRPPALKAMGLVVPHAGYMYSGHVAGAVYASVEIPSRLVILCPNHTGLGVPLSIMKTGSWQTPLGEMEIDVELCEALMAVDSDLQDDVEAHRFEHSLEVQ